MQEQNQSHQFLPYPLKFHQKCEAAFDYPPLLTDERFVQLHRSYVVNLAAVSQLAAGEFWMQSGARVPVPRGREPAARTALKDYLEKQFR